MGSLRVQYDSMGSNKELERELTELLKKYGYKWYAEGYTLREGVRDVSYRGKSQRGVGYGGTSAIYICI